MKILLVVFALVAAVYGQTPQQFQARIVITNDPNIRGGISGQLYYRWVDGPGGRSIGVQRINYGIGPTEIINFDRRLKYLYCSGTCDASTWNEPQAKFFRETSDTSVAAANVPGRGSCAGYQKTGTVANTAVRTIYVDGSNLPCRAVYGNGKTIDFNNLAALPAGNAIFEEYNNWQCPNQQCNKMIDFALVFDESGSIDSRSFTQIKTFGGDIARAYTFGPQNIAMSLVMFATNSRLAIGLTISQASFLNVVNNLRQTGGNTCITCGINTGWTELSTNGRGANIAKVMIFMTDGQGNRETARFGSAVTAAKNGGAIIFAIGVANYDISEIRFIASSLGTTQTVFTTPTFDQLGGILDSLIIATCIDIPGNPCGQGCLGFCSCGATCVCPDVCTDNNECTTDQCVPGQGGNGCVSTPKPCSDADLCTTDTCNPNVPGGCVFTNITCNDNNPCTEDFCIKSAGCQTVAKVCNDGDSCTADTCNPTTGCVFTPIPASVCGPCNGVICAPVPCHSVVCNISTGVCVPTPINCDDRNACSEDSCNPVTGTCQYTPVNCDDNDACTHDLCDPLTGCYNIPRNISLECNDNNVCTNDLCDRTTGCYHTNVTCVDDDPCTDNMCNTAFGCEYPITDCTSILSTQVDKNKRDCYVALCTRERNGCFVDQIPGTKIDNCQVCNGDGKSCVLGLSTGAVIGISAGLLAVIIIASVIVCAALGIFGGKKGYDIWLNHRQNMQAASTNPLYTDKGLAGNNPLYADSK